MGMFDNIEYQGQQYQTKDTPAQMLDMYKIEQDPITQDWYLWHEEYDSEWCQEPGQLFGGSLKQSNHRWLCCKDFDGEIRFYWYRSEADQEEYRALFMDGKMLKIRPVHHEPMTKWLADGIEAKEKE